MAQKTEKGAELSVVLVTDLDVEGQRLAGGKTHKLPRSTARNLLYRGLARPADEKTAAATAAVTEAAPTADKKGVK